MDDDTKMDLLEYFERTEGPENAFNFAIECGLMPNQSRRNCIKCGRANGMKFQKNSKFNVGRGKIPFMFVCEQKECRCTITINKNTIFDRSTLSLSQILRLMYFWLLKISSKDSADQLKQSELHIAQWYQIFAEVCSFIVINYTEAIGGPGRVVEISEYHLDDSEGLSELWVVTGVDRRSGQNFAIHVHSLDFDVLWPIIKNYILPGTVVVTRLFRDFKEREESEENPSLTYVHPSKCTRTLDDYNLDSIFAALNNYVQTEVPPDELDLRELYIYKFLYFNRDTFQNRPASELIIPFINDVKLAYPGFDKLMYFQYSAIDLNKKVSAHRRRKNSKDLVK